MKQIVYNLVNHPFRTVGEFFAVLSIFAMGYVVLVMFG